MHTLYWISQDRQATMQMGEYETEAAAQAAIEAAQAELLSQCGEEYQATAIKAGSWEVSQA